MSLFYNSETGICVLCTHCWSFCRSEIEKRAIKIINQSFGVSFLHKEKQTFSWKYSARNQLYRTGYIAFGIEHLFYVSTLNSPNL
jgi:hypothetical protein